ncbi:MAG: thymidine phosphorylase [Bacilli bacterium]|nr:thymidine phosphorylase [Bacilli bacterium]
MDIIEIINKKRLGKILKREEIKYVIDNYLSGNVADYQMSSLLMAIVINGMTDNEIIELTKIMLNSGEKLDLSSLGTVVDKHSTGGVGDKTTMIIAPIVASCGVNVAKMSGRGLGHTGGTIDKLESIPGFQVNISTEDFLEQVKKIGMAVVSQTNNLVPADKKIYALRDVTGTVESIPLIASSIMSKKIASGANKLVIDVKVGKGALIKTIKDARKLAKLMIKIGKANGIEVVCLLTNMDIPLGCNIGNALEVREAIDVLTNKSRGNLADLCIELSSYMVSLGLNITYKEAKSMVIDNLYDGRAYEKFLEFVKWQHGSLEGLPKAKNTYKVKSTKEGYLTSIDALALGKLSMHLGAGRASLEDEIDYGAGIIVKKNIGDYINKDDVLMELYTNNEIDTKEISTEAFSIQKENTKEVKLIYEIMK